MLVLRPAREDDLPGVLALSRLAKQGLTTLPSDERILGRRIRNSIESFKRLEPEPVAGDEYFLVLEDSELGEVVGTSAIVSKVGGFQPFYSYRIETSIHESESLGVHNEVQALHLFTDHDGPTEIGTLFLRPDARQAGAGRLLSLGRFLLIAEHPEAFDERIIAEMRGVIDDQGHSVFWEAVGRHFFDIDLATADHMSVEDKRFIADLMPTHPIYLPILAKEVRAVIGKVHPLTEPALHMLESEGFHDAGQVDIFEAGPVIECARDEIRSVRESRVARVASIGQPRGGNRDQPEYMLARRRGFRATKGPISVSDEGVMIAPELARALEIEVGDEVRYSPLRVLPEAKPGEAAGS